MSHSHKIEAAESQRAKMGRLLRGASGSARMSTIPIEAQEADREADNHGMKAAGASSLAKFKRGGAVHGEAAKKRLDRPVRKKKADGGVVDPVAEEAAEQHIDQLGTGSTSNQQKYARGGKVGKGKGKTTVNVVIAPQGGGQAAMPPPMPAGAPPVPPGPPAPPPAAPPMPPGAMGAGAAPPMPIRASGGRVPHMTAGSMSGEGRLEKIKEYGRKK